MALLPIFDRSRWRWAGPRLVQLVTGVGWWIAMTVGLAVAFERRTGDGEVLQALVIGGYAQILVASLAYLGPVLLRRGDPDRLTAGFTTTRSWLSVAAGNIAAIGAVIGEPIVTAVALIVWLVEISERTARLVLLRSTSARHSVADR